MKSICENDLSIYPLTESWVGVVGCYSYSWNSLPHESLNEIDTHIGVRMRELELRTTIRERRKSTTRLPQLWSNWWSNEEKKIYIYMRWRKKPRGTELNRTGTINEKNIANERVMISRFLKKRNCFVAT